MKSLRAFAGIIPHAGDSLSLAAVAAQQGMARPLSTTDLLGRFTVATFHADVATPSPESLGGHVDLTIRADGSYDLHVHMHTSGLPDYSFRLGIFLRATNGLIFALYSAGKVHGASPGSRDFDDPQTDRADAIQKNWFAFFNGQLDVQKEYQDNLTAWVESAILDKFTFIIGCVTLGGPATVVIWAASSLGNIAGVNLPGELGLSGLVAAEGEFFLVGPMGFIPVFIAGALVSAALLKRRGLHQEEIDEAYKVFKDTLEYGKIMVTNLNGLAGRAFTVPNIDDQIVMMAAPDTFQNFDNLIETPANKFVFIHELTHAWQYQHKATLTSICNIIGTRTNELLYGKNDTYNYTAGDKWAGYNMEQQGNIVADWYAANFNIQFNRADASANAVQENTRYIQENILLGRT